MSKIIVIGANHAGTSAINTILDNYKDHEVIAFDRNSNISFLGCGMALWIGGQIDGPEGLFYSSKEKLEGKGAKIYMETEIIDVDFDKKVVIAKDKNGKIWEESYDKLIIATGSVPIKPNIPGTDLKNVQFVKLYQNAQEVIEKLEHEKVENIAVVGAGYIGVELAEAFKRHGKNVEVIDLCHSCLTGYYDKPLRDMMEKNLLDHGVGLNFSEKLLEIKGDNKVEEILTDNKNYRADMVILAVGFKPNTILGKGKLETFKNGAYRVNRTQKTNIEDVYAIGDCATVYDNSIKDTSYIALATNAVRSAIVAAHNACGVHIESPGVQGSNGISVFGLNMVSTGLTFEKAEKLGYNVEKISYEDLQKPEFIVKNNDEVFIEIVYDKISRRILGAQMASRYDISMGIHMFSLAIQEEVTIDKLKLLDLFFLPHFNKPYNYITVAALKAK